MSNKIRSGMKHFIIPVFLFTLLACSSTRHLEMDQDVDLSALPGDAQCWLIDFEKVCISLSQNESFADSEQLQEDIARAATLMKEFAGEDSGRSWYASLSESQSDRLHELMLAIVIHYGVKHFLDV